MATTFATFKSDVRSLLGRSTDSSEALSATRIGQWVNEAQKQIAWDNPRLRILNVVDDSAWTVVEGQYSYALGDLANTCQAVLGLWFVDGTKNVYQLKPWVGGIKYWKKQVFPDLLIGQNNGLSHYQRWGDNLQLNSLPTATDAATAVIAIEYAKAVTDMSGDSDTPTLTDFDLAITYKALSMGLATPLVNKPQIAAQYEAIANDTIMKRVKSERSIDVSNRNPYQGPSY